MVWYDPGCSTVESRPIASSTSVRRSRLQPLLLLVLVSAWPLVNFANVNRDKAFSVPILLAFFAISCSASLLLYLLLSRLFRRIPGSVWACALVAAHVLFFGHATVAPALRRLLGVAGLGGSPAAWAVLVVAILAAAAWLGARQLTATAALAGLAVAVAVPAASLAAFSLRQWRAGAAETTRPIERQGTVVSRPNVYFVLVDGYGRTDTMQKYLQFDNSAYVAELRELDFFVAAKAPANYPMTFLSLSTVLNMDYVATESTPRYAERSRFNALLQGDNPAVRMFKGLGYAFVQAGSGMWQETNCRGYEDVCLEKETFGAGEVFRLGFGETEMALMELTPLFKQYIAAARARGVFEGAVTNLAGLAKALRAVDTSKPLFVVAHSYPPHPPFIYGPDCAIRDEIVHDYGPLRDRADDPAGRERYRRLYAESAECVSRQIVFFAREIARRDPTGIVIIQSDHGSDTRVDWSPARPLAEWTAEAIEERFGVLNAIRVPDRCREWLYDSMSPANTFRLVQGCLEGRPPTFLPDRAFVAGYENHPEFGIVRPYSLR